MPTSSETDLINFALTHVRYKLGGREFPYLDCWGLCRWFYSMRFGVALPAFLSLAHVRDLNTSPELAGLRQIPEPDDVCIFGLTGDRGIIHSGIYLHGRYFHCLNERSGCQLSDSLPYRKAWFQAEELL